MLQVLCEELPLLLAGLNFKRSMRWNSNAAFSRPLRWLMALHGAKALPLHYAGITAGNVTRLLRNSKQPEVTVSILPLAALLVAVVVTHLLRIFS